MVLCFNAHTLIDKLSLSFVLASLSLLSSDPGTLDCESQTFIFPPDQPATSEESDTTTDPSDGASSTD